MESREIILDIIRVNSLKKKTAESWTFLTSVNTIFFLKENDSGDEVNTEYGEHNL